MLLFFLFLPRSCFGLINLSDEEKAQDEQAAKNGNQAYLEENVKAEVDGTRTGQGSYSEFSKAGKDFS